MTEQSERVTRAITALVAIAPYRETHRGKGVVKIPCPACNAGTLAFSIAAINGHCVAKCETPDCVAFME